MTAYNIRIEHLGTEGRLYRWYFVRPGQPDVVSGEAASLRHACDTICALAGEPSAPVRESPGMEAIRTPCDEARDFIFSTVMVVGSVALAALIMTVVWLTSR
jgi:hypothetical protein